MATRPGTAIAGPACGVTEVPDGAPLSRTERLLRACRGCPVDRPPVWLMRQAGRYLPAYREVRRGLDFLETCRDVDRAVEISLQPLRLVGSEAVILFSDIFVPVLGMGVPVEFRPGPVLERPIRERAQVRRLRNPDPCAATPYVFAILRRLRQQLEAESVPVIGFAGAPWTLAAYLVEGRSAADFSAVKRMLYTEPTVLRELLDRLCEMTIAYLDAQFDAGAQVLQLFDTWAGLLGGPEYRKWILPYHQRIFTALRSRGAPTILYARGVAHVLPCLFDAGADVVSLDWRVDLGRAARRYGQRAALQGNLDPSALAASATDIERSVRELARAAAPARGYIANLGHGCLPDTPVHGVRAFTQAVRNLAPA